MDDSCMRCVRSKVHIILYIQHRIILYVILVDVFGIYFYFWEKNRIFYFFKKTYANRVNTSTRATSYDNILLCTRRYTYIPPSELKNVVQP